MHKIAGLAFSLCAAISLQAAASDLRIPHEEFKLSNGMRVVLSRDNAVPVVAVYVIYDVGARSEEKGRTGFAHLFEHMMFEGSANIKKGEHFKYVQSNGGTMNGSTHPDYTDYFETMPSNKLSLALWLESDRMRSLSITPENLKNQQEAVKEERRLSFDNQAYRTAIIENWPAMIYGNFQSSHSLIGSFEDLNAASVDDVAKFFKTYYAPNNAVLVIAGDFQTADAKKLIQQYFGDIPSQPAPKRLDATEPERARRQNGDGAGSACPRPGRGDRLAGAEAALARMVRARHARFRPHRWRKLSRATGSGEGQAVCAAVRSRPRMAIREF